MDAARAVFGGDAVAYSPRLYIHLTPQKKLAQAAIRRNGQLYREVFFGAYRQEHMWKIMHVRPRNFRCMHQINKDSGLEEMPRFSSRGGLLTGL